MLCLKIKEKAWNYQITGCKKVIKRSDGKLTGKSLTLIVQRAHRIERLLNLAKDDWGSLDVYEELTPCFFTSIINNCYNFDINFGLGNWVSKYFLIFTGQKFFSS